MLGRSHGRHLSRGVTQVSQSPSGCKYGTAWRGETEAGTQLEKNHVVPPSSQDGARAHYGVSREVPRSVLCIGEGNGNPLQYSCLENPTDRGAGWATVHEEGRRGSKEVVPGTSVFPSNGTPGIPSQKEGRSDSPAAPLEKAEVPCLN